MTMIAFLKKIAPQWVKEIYSKVFMACILIREILFVEKINDFKSIPIIINNFNRLTFLIMLIEAMEKRGYHNIIIIDNASTYPPLLKYYDDSPYRIIRLKENIGYKSLWETGLYKEFKNNYYVYTDSDVVPIEDCPDDFIEYFWTIMQKYKYRNAVKVGFSLNIHDLPDHNKNKQAILDWEGQFWQKPIKKDIYIADIDTTFALYRPNVNSIKPTRGVIRTGGLYSARHMPWYNNTSELSEEEVYYINHTKTSTHWTQIS